MNYSSQDEQNEQDEIDVFVGLVTILLTAVLAIASLSLCIHRIFNPVSSQDTFLTLLISTACVILSFAAILEYKRR